MNQSVGAGQHGLLSRSDQFNMKKHFVVFESPGTFVHEVSIRPIDSWNTAKAVKMSKSITERYNSKPFAFYFTTRERTEKDLDSKVTHESGRYFLGGRILTVEDVKREMPTEKILISNMENNGWKRVVVNDNSWRIYQPLTAKDTVLNLPAPKPRKAPRGSGL